MPITLNGTTGIGTPGVASTDAISGTTGTFSGNVTANGLTTELRPLVLGTSIASTSGTAIDFTGIPSWVKRITVMLNGVSTSGTSPVQIQIGDSGGIETTGYESAASYSNVATAFGASTTGFICDPSAVALAAALRRGTITLTHFGGNLWVEAGAIANFTTNVVVAVGGSKTLSDVLTQIRITTVNGTDTFDAGSINIMYE